MKGFWKIWVFLVLAVLFGLLTLLLSNSFALLYPAAGFNRNLRPLSSSGEKVNGDLQRRMKFLDFNKQGVFHLKPPVFLPGLKNPCWYQTTSTRSPSKKLHCLPYFLLIGQSKCGSTDLFSSIVSHPDVVPPRAKEAQFWAWNRHCNCTNYPTYKRRCSGRRPKTWTEYQDYFNTAAGKIQNHLKLNIDRSQIKLVTGEGTPSTFWDNRWWWNYQPNIDDEEAPALLNADYIHHFIPKVKMICILRNPVERLYSDYLFLHKKSASWNEKTFHEDVEREISLFNDCLNNHSVRYCVYFNTWYRVNAKQGLRIHPGFYSVYVRDWFSRFPQEQFLFVRLEDYSRSKNDTLSKIFKFLDLRDVKVQFKDTMLNNVNAKRKATGKMLQKTRMILERLYTPFNEELAGLLNDEKFLWQD